MLNRVGNKDPLIRMYLLGRWITDQVCPRLDRDMGDETLAKAAREQVNEWLEKHPIGDRSFWLAAEGWVHKPLRDSVTLYARLALHFMSADETIRQGVIIRASNDDAIVLGVVREAGPIEDYVLYDPPASSFSRYSSLEALCEGIELKPLRNQVDLYWPPPPKQKEEADAPAVAAAVVVVKQEPVTPAPSPAPAPTPSAPIRAKRPSATQQGARKRPSTALQPTSPLKKAAPEGSVSLIEESSGETAK